VALLCLTGLTGCPLVVGPYDTGRPEVEVAPVDAGPFVCDGSFDAACLHAADGPRLCDVERDTCVPPDELAASCAVSPGVGREPFGPVLADVAVVAANFEAAACDTITPTTPSRIEGVFLDLEGDAPRDAAEADLLLRWRAVNAAAPAMLGPLAWTPQQALEPGRFSLLVCGVSDLGGVVVQLLDTAGHGSNVACSP
jgi:hypothetical protein